jgi:helix-turn-helix resolvase-like protein
VLLLAIRAHHFQSAWTTDRAKARGRHMGRPSALTPQQQTEARNRRDEGATLKELAQSYNVGIATISRLSKKAAA